MDSEESLVNSIAEYEQQLQVVNSAIISSQSPSEDLLELRTKLEEIISLTKADLLVLKKQKLLNELEEFTSESLNIPASEEVSQASGSSDGLKDRKCRVPFMDQSGKVSFHNAMVMKTNNNGQAKVLFLNPVTESMKPCSYFLSGNCTKADNECRNSHGYSVSIKELKNFEEPDYSLIKRDSLCLVKTHLNELWRRAVVESYQEEDDKLIVKYENSDKMDTINFEDILPLNESESDSSDDDFEDNDNDFGDNVLMFLTTQGISSPQLGQWETYTKGIGSKLLQKMGYVFGKGLGKNGEGRTEPVGYCILPAGKSLDECMRWKENKALNSEKEEKKLKARKAKVEEKIAAGYNCQPKSDVFEFINKNVASVSKKKAKDSATIVNFKNKTNESLNVSMFKLSENLKKAEIELDRLKCAATRNKNRDKLVHSQLEERIKNQENLIKSLKDQETRIKKEQLDRSDKKKLTVF